MYMDEEIRITITKTVNKNGQEIVTLKPRQWKNSDLFLFLFPQLRSWLTEWSCNYQTQNKSKVY